MGQKPSSPITCLGLDTIRVKTIAIIETKYSLPVLIATKFITFRAISKAEVIPFLRTTSNRVKLAVIRATTAKCLTTVNTLVIVSALATVELPVTTFTAVPIFPILVFI